jgi:hypothetical protein
MKQTAGKWLAQLYVIYARPQAGPALVFVLSFVLLGATAATAPQRNLAFFDQPFYATTAWELLEYGVYGDGIFDAHDGAEGPPPAGMWLPPAWTLVLAVLMALDASLRDAASGLVRSSQPQFCPAYLGVVPAVQMMFVAGAITFFFLACRRLLPVGLAILASVICFLLLWRYVGILRLAMTEALGLLLFSASAYFLARALQGQLLHAALCGSCLALLTLTRPSHLLLIPFGALALGICVKGTRRAILGAVLLAVAALAVLSPWAIRNHAMVGKLALSDGYGGAIFTERLAWNEMTGQEWLLSFLYNLPDTGNGLAEQIFGRDAVLRLDWNQPTSFYENGQAARGVMLGAPGGPPSMGQAVAALSAGEWAWHAMTSLSMAWRGMWIGRTLALMSFPLMLLGVLLALRGRSGLVIVLWLAPAWLMLGAHAALSVNQERYNLALAFPWAFATALGAAWLMQRLGFPDGPERTSTQ